MKYAHDSGFIALMSVIIIAVTLLTVVGASNLTGFYARFNVLDAELKERSRAGADACAEMALLRLRQHVDPSTYSASLTSLDSCRVVGAVAGTAQKTLTIQATSSSAVTNLRIVVDASTLSVVSWQEISPF